jgi:hypothetical protein
LFYYKTGSFFFSITLLLQEGYSQLDKLGGLTVGRVQGQMRKTEHSRFPKVSETKQRILSYPSQRTLPLFVWAMAVTTLLHECPSVGICVLIKKF